MLPHKTRVDLGPMAMKGYSAFPNAPAPDSLVSYIGYSSEESYPSAMIQLVYSAAPANWTLVGGLTPLQIGREEREKNVVGWLVGWVNWLFNAESCYIYIYIYIYIYLYMYICMCIYIYIYIYIYVYMCVCVCVCNRI